MSRKLGAYQNDKFKIIPCIGESGTLVVFDSKGLHRLDLKLDTFRSHLHLNFVPGNDLIEYSQDILDCYSPKAKDELATLEKYQAKSFSHLYPSYAYILKPLGHCLCRERGPV